MSMNLEPPPFDEYEGPWQPPLSPVLPPDISHLNVARKEARLRELQARMAEDGYDRLTPVEQAELGELVRDDFADVGSLEDWCEVPPDDLQDRLGCLNVVGTNSVLYALYKCGKSVMYANLLRTYADGAPFLGQFDLVTPLRGNVVIWEYEDTDAMLFDRLAGQRIQNQQRIIPRPMRGRPRYPENDDDAEVLAQHAKQHEAEVVLINTMSTAMQTDPNKPKNASAFLARLEEIKAAAGFTEYIMVAHTGHAGTRGEFGIPVEEHVFGSSRFMGWYDALWRYSIGSRDRRFLSVTGRQRCVPPQLQVDLDPTTMRLAARDVEARDERLQKVSDEQVKTDMLAYLEGREDVSQSELFGSIGGLYEVKRRVRDLLVEGELIRVRKGARKSVLHSLVES